MNVVAIIQARMGSTRLPGKVLMDVAGEPMLLRCVERTSRARTISHLVVATTTRRADDVIQDLCVRRGVSATRGSENDVLDRYYRTAAEFSADAIVRVTADCPLIDPMMVDRVVETFRRGRNGTDYTCNFLPRRTFPRGLDVEVVSMPALASAWREATRPECREHVTSFVNQQPGRFGLGGVTNAVDLSGFRWTVDTQEDLEFVRRIFESFGHDRFSWIDVLELLEKRPELAAINAHVRQKESSHTPVENQGPPSTQHL